MIYKYLLRPLFWQFDAERTHTLAIKMLEIAGKSPFVLNSCQKYLSYESPRLCTNPIENLHFANPIGLAAGFDKYASLYPTLSSCGFGFLELGTFTYEPQDGNPKPRLYRAKEQKALINKMGFNNPGAKVAATKIQKFKLRKVPLGINLGKSKIVDIEKASEDYYKSMKCLLPFADYITINISSPNTPNLRQLQNNKELRNLLQTIMPLAKEKNCPVFIKIAPDLSEELLEMIVAECINFGCAGMILCNTTNDISVLQSKYQQFSGHGISGQPVRVPSTAMIRKCFQLSKGKLIIIGVGGVECAKSALDKILAGASLLQIYTGYIYEGPRLPYTINKGIDEFLLRQNCNLSDIIGSET